MLSVSSGDALFPGRNGVGGEGEFQSKSIKYRDEIRLQHVNGLLLGGMGRMHGSSMKLLRCRLAYPCLEEALIAVSDVASS